LDKKKPTSGDGTRGNKKGQKRNTNPSQKGVRKIPKKGGFAGSTLPEEKGRSTGKTRVKADFPGNSRGASKAFGNRQGKMCGKDGEKTLQQLRQSTRKVVLQDLGGK